MIFILGLATGRYIPLSNSDKAGAFKYSADSYAELYSIK